MVDGIGVFSNMRLGPGHLKVDFGEIGIFGEGAVKRTFGVGKSALVVEQLAVSGPKCRGIDPQAAGPSVMFEGLGRKTFGLLAIGGGVIGAAGGLSGAARGAGRCV